MRNLLRIRHGPRDEQASLPHVDRAALRHQVVDGVPAFIGEPDIDLENGLADLSIDTQEGFALLAAVFPDQSPTELRALIQQQHQQQQQHVDGRGARSDSTHTVCSAVEELAALDPVRAKLAAHHSTALPLLTKQLPSVPQYLGQLAAAAAADVAFVVPGTQVTSHGYAEKLDTVQQPGFSSGANSSVAEPAEVSGVCELCGDPTPDQQLAACSRGHAVCSLCLRQYILYTHGLQAGLASLKCLAFASDGSGPDEAAAAAAAPAEHRCPGGYSRAHLAAALKPTELLQLSLADARREARVAAARAVPFRCTVCKHQGSIGVATIREALATTVRSWRLTACGLRRRWVAVGVAPLPCPGPGCKARYCPRCGGAEHAGTLCSPDTQDAKLMEWAAQKKKAVQRCPQCYRLIEKGGGCKYMQCPKPLGGCGHEFCWQCREPFLGLHHCGKLPQDYEE